MNAQELDVVFIKYQSPSIVCVRQSTSEKNEITNVAGTKSLQVHPTSQPGMVR